MQAARGTPLTGDPTDPAQPADPALAATTPARRLGIFAAVALVAYALDQASKWLAVERLSGRAPVEVVEGLLQLRLVRNSGAAFSIGGGATLLFTLVALAVVAVVLRTARRLRSVPWALALGLLLGGALGNLTDRVLRPPAPLRGHVIDFLELPHWPVFNVADMAIVSSAALIVLLTLLGHHLDGTRASAHARE